MRFGAGRPKIEEPSTYTADVVLQLGESRIPSKAEKVLGTNTKLTRENSADDLRARQASQGSAREEELGALDDLPRSQETSIVAPRGPTDQRVYWSPDDISNAHNRNPAFVVDSQHWQPDASVAPLYAQSQYAPYVNNQTSSAVRDFAAQDGIPTRSDTFGETYIGRNKSDEEMRRDEEVRRSKTLGAQPEKSSRRPRKLDLAQFFPQSRSSNQPIAANGSKSPSTAGDKPDSLHTTPPATGGLSSGSKRPKTSSGTAETLALRPLSGKKELEGDIFDPKTNVRRPPKGIQNWFDAYLSSDEEFDDEDEGVPVSYELSGEDVHPPAYECPSRNRSTNSNDTSSSGLSTDRKQSADSRCAGSTHEDSVLSMTSSEGDFEAYQGSRRDNCGRNRSVPDSHSNLMESLPPFGVPYTTALQQRPYNLRSYSHESLVNSTRDSTQVHFTYQNVPLTLNTRSLDKPLPLPPDSMSPTSTSPRHESHRLNSVSMRPRTTEAHPDIQPDLAQDTAHMMAVTEEEMILLDMMRRKRAAMQQMSFSEGYQTALRRESEGSNARSGLPPYEFLRESRSSERRPGGRSLTVSVPPSTNDEWTRRQFSAIRKEDVDNAIKFERFLAMQAPPTLTATHPAFLSPVELPGSMPDEYDSDTSNAKVKVKKFLAQSNGIYPNSAPSARSGARRQSARASMPPSPVPEEEPLEVSRESEDHVVMRDNPKQLPLELQMVAQMLQRTSLASEYSLSADGSQLERKGSDASFLSRQDSTKHLEHLRPAADAVRPLELVTKGRKVSESSLQATSSPSRHANAMSPLSSLTNAVRGAEAPLTRDGAGVNVGEAELHPGLRQDSNASVASVVEEQLAAWTESAGGRNAR